MSVLQIGSNGSLTEIAGSPFGLGTGFAGCVGILSPDERFLFVANVFGNSVSVFSVAANGSLSLVAGSPFTVFGLASPSGLATNRSGTLLFCASTFPEGISVAGINPTTGVLTNSLQGNLFPTGQSGQVQSVAVFPSAQSGPPPGAPLSRVLAADTANHRVQVFDGINWSLAPGTSGVIGGGPGQFRSPEAVTATSNGTIFVADTGNNRIQRFDGSTWSTFAFPGSGLNQVLGPQGVAVDATGTFLFVADTGNNRILRFSTTAPGTPGTVLATFGSGPGQVRSPRGLGIDRDGNLFIADTGNNQVLRLPGATTVTTANLGITIASLGSGTTPTQVRAPEGVAWDDGGNLLIADTGNNRVLSLPNGLPGTATVLTTPGGALGQTIAPEGVTITALPTGLLIFVSDTGNNRIQIRPSAGGAWSLASGPAGQTATLGIGQFRSPSKVR